MSALSQFLGGSGGSSEPFQYQEFIESDTWTPPDANAYYEVLAEIIGGGGGGGSGYSYSATGTPAASISVYGGYGAARGAEHRIHAIIFGAQNVTVGAGGNGGASRTTNGPGDTGAAGGASSFGRWVAQGGAAGLGGTTSTSPSSESAYRKFIDSISVSDLTSETPAVFNGGAGMNAPTLFNLGGTSYDFRAYGGAGGAGVVAPASAAVGGDAASSTVGDVTAEAGDQADTGEYGAGGAGGGAAIAYRSSTPAYIAASGAGGAGTQGIVRLWYRKA